MSNLGDPKAIIQSGPTIRSGGKRKAYPIKSAKVAHSISTRPGSILNLSGHPAPRPRIPPLPRAGGQPITGFTEATSNFGVAAVWAEDWSWALRAGALMMPAMTGAVRAATAAVARALRTSAAAEYGWTCMPGPPRRPRFLLEIRLSRAANTEGSARTVATYDTHFFT
jgi:hypothetical protein